MDNFWEAAKLRLQIIGEWMGLESEIIGLLSRSMHVSEFQIPLRMDNGKLQVFTAYRVRHNDALGPARDGTRIKPDLTLDDLKALALIMSIKHAVADIPAGGGKGGIVAAPQKLSERELERLCRAYIRRLSPRGAWSNVPGMDMGTSLRTQGWMLDEYEQIVGFHSPAAIDDKPPILGGTLGSSDATGRGLSHVTVEVCRSKDLPPQSCRVAIQGFGCVGSGAAKCLRDQGFKVIAVSDIYGGIFAASGLDITKVLNHFGQTGSVVGFPGAKAISNRELLEMDCEILIPAAVENVIDEENAGRVKAKIIVEGANGPLTPSADKILLDKRITVIPDVLANSGGVIVCQFERTQNLSDMYWDLATIHERLQARILRAYKETVNTGSEMNISLRDAAWVNALSKIGKALRMRGWV